MQRAVFGLLRQRPRASNPGLLLCPALWAGPAWHDWLNEPSSPLPAIVCKARSRSALSRCTCWPSSGDLTGSKSVPHTVPHDRNAEGTGSGASGPPRRRCGRDAGHQPERGAPPGEGRHLAPHPFAEKGSHPQGGRAEAPGGSSQSASEGQAHGAAAAGDLSHAQRQRLPAPRPPRPCAGGGSPRFKGLSGRLAGRPG